MGLHAEHRGRGAPILILHGGRLDHRHMLDALEPVFDGIDGWHRVYLDLPGCGASTGFDDVASQDDVLAHVSAFAAECFGETPVAVIGESRGALISQGLAHLYPDRVTGLCLIVPGEASAAEAARPLPFKPVSLPQDGLDPDLRARAERLVERRPEIVDKIRDLKLPAARAHDVGLEARVARRFRFSFHDAMEEAGFERPSLVISGRQDGIAGQAEAMALALRMPRATFALLDRAGHSLAWERPSLFAALLRDWLSRVRGTSSDRAPGVAEGKGAR